MRPVIKRKHFCDNVLFPLLRENTLSCFCASLHHLTRGVWIHPQAGQMTGAVSTASNHEGGTGTSRERGAQGIIRSFLLWVHPQWKCLFTRLRNETTNLLLAFKAMWNPKKALQSLAVLTDQPSTFAPGIRHRDVREGNKWDPFGRSLQREEQRYRAHIPVR